MLFAHILLLFRLCWLYVLLWLPRAVCCGAFLLICVYISCLLYFASFAYVHACFCEFVRLLEIVWLWLAVVDVGLWYRAMAATVSENEQKANIHYWWKGAILKRWKADRKTARELSWLSCVMRGMSREWYMISQAFRLRSTALMSLMRASRIYCWFMG